MSIQLHLIDGGASDWTIVVGEAASSSEKYAAEELQRYLQQMSGATLRIVDDAGNLPGGRAVLVGDSRSLTRIGGEPDWEELGDEGFVIRTQADCLIIAGGRRRGTLYGVYTFLERYLGCRWFTPQVSSIPSRATVILPDIDVKTIPQVDYRECYYYDGLDGDWCAKLKLNGHFARLDGRHGGKLKYKQDHFVHTFCDLVPVDEYYDAYPEYFSEVDGVRLREDTQLCLTHPDVFELALAQVKRWIVEEPDATIFSVSQNDCYNPCQCSRCRAVDEEEGSYSGSLLRFVNRIAEAIVAEHPDKYIDTLAYQYTRKPPRRIRPARNVIVRLCSFECCFSHPMDECRTERNTDKTGGQTFNSDFQQWSRICDRIYIWDYVTDFAHYILPFPNLHVLRPNIRFFIRNSVKGIFEQGNYSSSGGEFAELRTYVTAKLLWNPDEDTDALIDDFLRGYYGQQAAVPLRAYIDMLRDKVVSGQIHLYINAGPSARHLSADIISRANELFDRAEAAAESEEIAARVRVARLPVQYVQICALPEGSGERRALAERFYSTANSAGIRQLKEAVPLTLEELLVSGPDPINV